MTKKSMKVIGPTMLARRMKKTAQTKMNRKRDMNHKMTMICAVTIRKTMRAKNLAKTNHKVTSTKYRNPRY